MIKVLEKAFSILELLAGEPGRAMQPSEISDSVGLNLSTTVRILKSMAKRGYVEQAGARKGYVLGAMSFMLGGRSPYRTDLVARAEPLLAGLASKIGESAILAVLRNDRRLTLALAEADTEVRVNLDAVQSDDVFQTATGRLLLSQMNEAEIRSFIDRKGLPGVSWPEVKGKAALVRALAEISKQKVVVCRRPGIVGLAAGINDGGKVTAALGVYMPEYRFSGSHKKEVLTSIMKTAREIQSRLSGESAKIS